MNSFVPVCAAALLSAGLLSADVSYQQTTKFEGGTMIDMMQKMASMPMMGRMLAGQQQAFQDQHYDIYLKGNKMARWGSLSSTIYDLDAGTVTTINNKKQTYNTTTFEEMQQRMEQMQQRTNHGQSDIDFDVKTTNTGETQVIDGEAAKETMIVMTAKQASSQGQMVITNDAWMVPNKPEYREVVEFQKKLAAKFAYAFSGAGPGLAQTGKATTEALSQAAKQNAYPVLSHMTVTGVAAAGPLAAMGGGNSDPNAPLIKIQTTTDHFTAGAVDDSKFVLPAGYKEEKHGRN